jgi:hypothetical protein
MAMAKTATQKMQTPEVAKIVKELPPGARNWGPPGATMVISTPREIDFYVRKIPKGKLATLESLRHVIAARHGTTITCPVTTGIFLGSVARAAAEQEMLGVTSHPGGGWCGATARSMKNSRAVLMNMPDALRLKAMPSW